MQIVGPTEPSVILSFQVSVGTKTGSLHLGFPSKPFDPLLAKLARASSPGPQTERNSEEERQRILKRLASTQLTVSAELASVPILLQDVLALRPGDIIDTQLGRTSEVSLLFEGRRLFRGLAASHAGRRAVKLTEMEA
jgi:flagellar motor switch protein FliM